MSKIVVSPKIPKVPATPDKVINVKDIVSVLKTHGVDPSVINAATMHAVDNTPSPAKKPGQSASKSKDNDGGFARKFGFGKGIYDSRAGLRAPADGPAVLGSYEYKGKIVVTEVTARAGGYNNRHMIGHIHADSKTNMQQFLDWVDLHDDKYSLNTVHEITVA